MMIKSLLKNSLMISRDSLVRKEMIKRHDVVWQEKGVEPMQKRARVIEKKVQMNLTFV